MLNKKCLPTPLIPAHQRLPIMLNHQVWQKRFRTLYLLYHSVILLSKLLALKIRGRWDDRRVGRLLRDLFQRFGILWIKVGQLLSMRLDLFSPEICTELSRLQDRASGFPAEAAIRIIEAELGQPIEQVFSQFEKTPFAAASISQVHRARLCNGKGFVAIKVRKPGTQETFQADMQIIRGLVRLLQWLSIRPYMRWSDMQWEIEQLMTEELDYHYEAANMKRMRKTLKSHKIYVPKVFAKYSSECILTMEFVEGVLMSDYLSVLRTNPERIDPWLQANHIKPELVGRRLFTSMMRQLLEDNLFHGDLHPGNIMLLRDSRIACIDFGSIGFMDQAFLEKYGAYLEALTRQQYGKVFDIYLQFPNDIPPTDLSPLKAEFTHLLQSWDERCRIAALPYTEKSIIALNDAFLHILGKHEITMTWDFLRFTRAAATADAAFRVLMPKLDVIRLTQKYLQHRVKRGFNQLLRRRTPPDDVLFDQHALLEMPANVSEAMALRNTIMRQQAHVHCGHTPLIRGLNTLLIALTLSLRLSGFFLLFECIEQQQTTAGLDVQVWVLIFLMLGYTDRVVAKLKKRCRTRYPQYHT